MYDYLQVKLLTSPSIRVWCTTVVNPGSCKKVTEYLSRQFSGYVGRQNVIVLDPVIFTRSFRQQKLLSGWTKRIVLSSNHRHSFLLNIKCVVCALFHRNPIDSGYRWSQKNGRSFPLVQHSVQHTTAPTKPHYCHWFVFFNRPQRCLCGISNGVSYHTSDDNTKQGEQRQEEEQLQHVLNTGG